MSFAKAMTPGFPNSATARTKPITPRIKAAAATKMGRRKVTSNGEVEGPHRSAPRRRGRTISQRPRRQSASASRVPPTIVRRHVATKARHVDPQESLVPVP
jgi:hypothetical protein